MWIMHDRHSPLCMIKLGRLLYIYGDGSSDEYCEGESDLGGGASVAPLVLSGSNASASLSFDLKI